MGVERQESIETALDDALDAIVSGDPAAARHIGKTYAPELDDLVETAGRIRSAVITAGPSPAAKAKHLQMIRESAARLAEQARPARRKPRFVRRFVLRPALVMGLLLALAAPAAFALSARAVPGDPLYSTKLALEQARLALANDPAKEVDLNVEFAQRRVEELDAITGKGLRAQAVAPVLDKLQEHQKDAAEGVATLRSEGRAVGPLEERVAVSLQRSTRRLTTIRTEMGCSTDGDRRCQVIAVAVDTSEQTLRTVDEGVPPAPSGEAGPGPVAPPTDPAPEGPGPQPDPVQPPVSGTGPDPAVPPPAVDPGTRPTEPTQLPSTIIVGPQRVEVDIKPTDPTNSLDVNNRLEVPVMIRNTPDFDPATLDLSTVCFGDDTTDPANSDCTIGEVRSIDLDGDGDDDLLALFQVPETGIDFGDTEACFAGKTTEGMDVKGCDALSVLGVDPTSVPGGQSPNPAGVTPDPAGVVPGDPQAVALI